MKTVNEATARTDANRRKADVLDSINFYIAEMVFSLALVFTIMHFFEVGFVRGDSMNPTIEDGQMFFMNGNAEVKKNDVIIVDFANYAYEGADDETIIKRCVATGGDTVEIKNGYLYINDEKADDPFGGEMEDLAKFTLDDDQVYVLGDNRLLSYDSRSFGPVDVDDIVGVARLTRFKKLNFGGDEF